MKKDTTSDHKKAHHPLSKLRLKGAEDIFKVRKTLVTRYKILYITMVFTGLTLCWYGVWMGVQETPILNHPVVAIIVGLALLALTGRVNKLE